MDHMAMQVGETQRAENCAARKSPLGWVILGGMHARVTIIELTHFWTTESMGVKSPSGECGTGRI